MDTTLDHPVLQRHHRMPSRVRPPKRASALSSASLTATATLQHPPSAVCLLLVSFSLPPPPPPPPPPTPLGGLPAFPTQRTVSPRWWRTHHQRAPLPPPPRSSPRGRRRDVSYPQSAALSLSVSLTGASGLTISLLWSGVGSLPRCFASCQVHLYSSVLPLGTWHENRDSAFCYCSTGLAISSLLPELTAEQRWSQMFRVNRMERERERERETEVKRGWGSRGSSTPGVSIVFS